MPAPIPWGEWQKSGPCRERGPLWGWPVDSRSRGPGRSHTAMVVEAVYLGFVIGNLVLMTTCALVGSRLAGGVPARSLAQDALPPAVLLLPVPTALPAPPGPHFRPHVSPEHLAQSAGSAPGSSASFAVCQRPHLARSMSSSAMALPMGRPVRFSTQSHCPFGLHSRNTGSPLLEMTMSKHPKLSPKLSM